MRTLVLALRPLAAVAALVVVSGCSTAPGGAPGPEPQALPDWVLVVPSATAERAYYVGGCLRAATLDAGLAEAEADARAQADKAARDRMRTLADTALREANVETSGVERAGFRALVVDSVAERLSGLLTVEQSFHRSCPEQGSPEAVCEVYALLSADLEMWDRLPEELLTEARVEQERAGKEKATQLLDWMLSRYREAQGGASEAPDTGTE